MQALIIYDEYSVYYLAQVKLPRFFRRSPGREAYPSDVFYLHTRLLDLDTKNSLTGGGGSLVALFVIGAEAVVLSTSNPTGVVSITDGQIFLKTVLSIERTRPTVYPTPPRPESDPPSR